MNKKDFIESMTTIFNDIYLPLLRKEIEQQVAAEVRKVVFHELEGEIFSHVRKLVSNRVEADIRVRVKQ